jgi:hypothetical protein
LTTISGLKRRTFWIIIALVATVVIITGVVGGVLGSKQKSSSRASGSGATPTSTSPPPNPTSPRSNTALTVPSRSVNSTVASGILIYQAFSNELYFSRISADGGHDTPSSLGADFQAKPNTPLSALSVVDGPGFNSPFDSSLKIHVFFIDASSYLSDAILSNGTWNLGTLRSYNVKPAASSKLASTVWFESKLPTLWIFFQNNDGFIAEYGFSNGLWRAGNSGPTVNLRASLGSGIGTCYDIDRHGFQRLRVYTQVPGGSIVSRDYDESNGLRWNDLYPLYQARNDVEDISVVTSRNTNMTVETVKIFFVDGGEEVYVLNFGINGWARVPEYVVEKSDGTVAAADQDELRVYFQENNGTVIREARSGGDSKWEVTDNRIG